MTLATNGIVCVCKNTLEYLLVYVGLASQKKGLMCDPGAGPWGGLRVQLGLGVFGGARVRSILLGPHHPGDLQKRAKRGKIGKRLVGQRGHPADSACRQREAPGTGHLQQKAMKC